MEAEEKAQGRLEFNASIGKVGLTSTASMGSAGGGGEGGGGEAVDRGTEEEARDWALWGP